MTFWCDGCRYESGEMRQYLTKDPYQPVILISPDNRCVFIMTLGWPAGWKIRQANTLEIISLASKYQIKGLLQAFPASKVADVEMEVQSELAWRT